VCNLRVYIPSYEDEVAKTLKNKWTAGPDDIPECLVKQCIGLIKKPLTHIYIISPLARGFSQVSGKQLK
jgi:hypothetical protein